MKERKNRNLITTYLRQAKDRERERERERDTSVSVCVGEREGEKKRFMCAWAKG